LKAITEDLKKEKWGRGSLGGYGFLVQGFFPWTREPPDTPEETGKDSTNMERGVTGQLLKI